MSGQHTLRIRPRGDDVCSNRAGKAFVVEPEQVPMKDCTIRGTAPALLRFTFSGPNQGVIDG
jgi:hypothetical protein